VTWLASLEQVPFPFGESFALSRLGIPNESFKYFAVHSLCFRVPSLPGNSRVFRFSPPNSPPPPGSAARRESMRLHSFRVDEEGSKLGSRARRGWEISHFSSDWSWAPFFRAVWRLDLGFFLFFAEVGAPSQPPPG